MFTKSTGNACSAVSCLPVVLAVVTPHHLHLLTWKLVNKHLRLYHVWWTANIISWCLGWLNTMVGLSDTEPLAGSSLNFDDVSISHRGASFWKIVHSAVMPLSHVQEEPWLTAVVKLLSRTWFEVSGYLIYIGKPCSQSETSIFCSHAEHEQKFITFCRTGRFPLVLRPFLSEQACFSH